MRVIVTRPAAQAALWAQHLNTQGIAAVPLPLIEIAPAADVQSVEAAWRELAGQQLAVFASPNAVEQFFVRRPSDAAWPQGLAAASLGPGTTQALSLWGVPPQAIIEPAAESPQFDSEALWRRLGEREWSQAKALIVRGDGGRDWLADRLRERGAQVSFIAAYRRVAPRFAGAALQCLNEALAHPDAHLWFFSSSEAIEHLVQARPAQSWQRARALATHPRIALRARACGFAEVHESRPTLDAVVACIQSIAL